MTLQKWIAPLNPALADHHVRTETMDWIQTDAKGLAFIKVLWTGPETGHYAVIFRWLKGFVAPSHKHLSASHTYILSGQLKVRDTVLVAGDYIYEPNGMIHDATTALEDTDYLFIGEGALLFFEGETFTHVVGWEQMARTARSGQVKPR
jgi:hypothetical protein